MSGPDADAIGPLKRKDGEPVFDEPWQAQVLAMADALVQRGAFTPVEWSDTLGEELRRAERAHSPDEATTHYQAALGALERLLDRKGAVTAEALSDRRDGWARAYLATPHGQPVKLDNGRPLLARS